MLLHWLATMAITAAVLAGVGLGAIAWRLSQGPVDLPWLTHRLEVAANANAGPTRLSIGAVALTWEGFRRGVDSPLDLRLTDVALTDKSGGSPVRLPQVEVSLSLYQLLLRRIAVRAVVLDAPQLELRRAEDGTVSLDLGGLAGDHPVQRETTARPLTDLLAELARPPANDRSSRPGTLFDQLRVVRIHDASVSLEDNRLGATWRAPRAEIELRRAARGGVDGTAELTLALGQQQARLAATVNLDPDASEMRVRARLSSVTPSALAGAAPALAPLSMVDAPLTTEASLDLDRNLVLRQAHLSIQAASGVVHIDQAAIPIVSAALVASATPGSVLVQRMQVTLRGHFAGAETHIEAHGSIDRDAGRVSAALSVDLDQVDFADLPALWPAGTGGDARDWIVRNITAGTAHNGHVDLGLAAEADLSSLTLTRASGTLDGDGLRVHWLRPIPPIDNGQAQLRIVDPDTLEIVVASGRQEQHSQKPTGGGGLLVRSGRMRITGIIHPHQTSTIEADVAGPLADAIALLREPRLQLLDRHPIELRNPAGQATVKLTLGLPLDKNVSMDDVSIQAQAHLEGVHLSGIAAGRDLDHGTLDIDANADSMKLTGRALLASIPARIDAALDFRAGPASQVVQSITVSGAPDSQQLAAVGLDATAVIAGPMPLQAVLTERRGGQGDIAVAADLTAAELSVGPLGWRKPRNASARAQARLVLDHDRLAGIESVQADGDGLVLRGRADVQGGRIIQLRVDRLLLGRTDVQGTVQMPQAPAAPILASVSGQTIDLTQRLAGQRTASHGPHSQTEPPPGPPWTLDGRFTRILMAHDRMLSDVTLHITNDGTVVRQLNLNGHIANQAPLLVQIVPDAGGRRLTASAADVGDLLNGLDVLRTMQGGALSVEARYQDTEPGRPLVGTATIENFRIRNAPALARLLQAMTLYGLVEVVQGPGLGFTRLVAPFRLTDDALDLTDARAFSSSLGLTAKGRVDLDAQQIDVLGTIVPAYFFNALLGNIPLVGKLFSPERGGGVFAASYTLHGSLDDPQVFVNPLTALTPGFLRGIFGIF